MWTLPDPPDGFVWHLKGGQDGKGQADLKLLSTGILAASVMRWGDGWAFLPGPWKSGRPGEHRPAPTRGRALAWAARWAVAHRPVLEFLAAGPPGPPGINSPFRLAPPAPRLRRGQMPPEEAFWTAHFRHLR